MGECADQTALAFACFPPLLFLFMFVFFFTFSPHCGLAVLVLPMGGWHSIDGIRLVTLRMYFRLVEASSFALSWTAYLLPSFVVATFPSPLPPDAHESHEALLSCW